MCYAAICSEFGIEFFGGAPKNFGPQDELAQQVEKVSINPVFSAGVDKSLLLTKDYYLEWAHSGSRKSSSRYGYYRSHCEKKWTLTDRIKYGKGNPIVNFDIFGNKI